MITRFSRRGFMAAMGGAALTPLMMTPLMVTGHGARAQGQELIVNGYGGSWEKFWREGLLPGFERASGIKTKYDSGLSRTWTANLRAAGPDKPPYTFIMMNEIFAALLRGEGYFEPWPIDKVPNLRHVHPQAKYPDNNGVFGMISPIGIGYRTDMVKKVPTSWKDLWTNPELKGKIGMYQIGNSAGFMFLMLASKIFGKGPLDFDAGFREIEKLKPFPQVDFSGTMGQLITRSEIAAGILDLPEVVRLRRGGAPVAFAAPSEGMFMFEQSFNLLKNGTNKDAAYRYLDYVLSEDIQKRAVNEFFITPVNVNVAIPPELKDVLPIGVNDIDKILKWDWAAANAQRDVVTERWNRVMR
ncbi:MAG: extracellular solute-binding protein [Alphaproteobacteria bacterium]|nr:extracellular solute-binding protein [Alphaproteobacteria bacterium]